MKKKTMRFVPILYFFLNITLVNGQQQAQQHDDDMSPDGFSAIIKSEWAFLRDGIDQINNDIGKRGEFETTPEFQARAARTRQVFLDKLSKHIKDAKLDKRVFGIWFKAILDSYEADTEIYSIKCATSIEAPYDLPTVECIVPPNPYIEMADSIRGGYRISYIRLKFEPDFKWKVARTEALNAKGNEQSIYFKTHFILNLTTEDNSSIAKLLIIPTDIVLINQQNKFVYWKDEIR